jgi:hypothetical protein
VIHGLTEQAGEQGDKDKPHQGDAAASHELLHSLRLGSGIVIAITFEKVDCAPNTEASAKGDYEGLKNVNSGIKEIHDLPPYCCDLFLGMKKGRSFGGLVCAG